MEIINSWWFGLALTSVVTIGVGFIVKSIVKNRRWSRILALATSLSLEVVQVVESRYPKGQSPGAVGKANEALMLLKKKLSDAGYDVNLSEPKMAGVLTDKIETAHATLTLDKASGYNESPPVIVAPSFGRHG